MCRLETVAKELALSGGGGGASVRRNFFQHGGDLIVESCLSHHDGGGLRIAGTFSQASNSSAGFKACRAQRGGCMSVAGSVYLSGISRYSQCVAFGDPETGGTCMFRVHIKSALCFVPSLLVHLQMYRLVSLQIAGTGGGGIFVKRNFSQLEGATNFIACQTANGGGGLQVQTGCLTLQSGSIAFKSCSAGASGGGAQIGLHVYAQANADMTFDDCYARSGGGGWDALGRVRDGMRAGKSVCVCLPLVTA